MSLVYHKWTLYSPSSQPGVVETDAGPRYSHASVVLPSHGVVLLMGGIDGDGRLCNDVFAFSLTANRWLDVTVRPEPDAYGEVSSLPAPRASHSLVSYTSSKGARHTVVVLFGGFDGHRRLNDVWELVIVTSNSGGVTVQWRHRACSGKSPSPRSGHVAVVARSTMIVHGGFDGRGCAELAELDLRDWKWKVPGVQRASVAALREHAGVLYNNHLYVFGGLQVGVQGATAQLSRGVYEYDVRSRSWRSAAVRGSTPSARLGHTAVLCGEHDMIVFGGLGSASSDAESVRLNDVHLLDLKRMQWTPLNVAPPNATNKPPHARLFATAWCHREFMFVHGGEAGGGVALSSLYACNLVTADVLERRRAALVEHSAHATKQCARCHRKLGGKLFAAKRGAMCRLCEQQCCEKCLMPPEFGHGHFTAVWCRHCAGRRVEAVAAYSYQADRHDEQRVTSRRALATRPLEELDVHAVMEWLVILGLDTYVDACERRQLDGRTLMSLSEAEARDRLGISRELHSLSFRLGHARLLENQRETDNYADLTTWSAAFVRAWLTEIELDALAPRFLGHGVHGAVLAALDERALVDLGITMTLHRHKLLKCVQQRLTSAMPDQIDTMRVADVCAWMRSIGLGEYEAKIREHSISGVMLRSVIETQWVSLVGIADEWHLRSLRAAINGLVRRRRAPRSHQNDPKRVLYWNLRRVVRRLEQANLGELLTLFEQRAMHGAAVLRMDKNDLGAWPSAHRAALRAFVGRMQEADRQASMAQLASIRAAKETEEQAAAAGTGNVLASRANLPVVPMPQPPPRVNGPTPTAAASGPPPVPARIAPSRQKPEAEFGAEVLQPEPLWTNKLKRVDSAAKAAEEVADAEERALVSSSSSSVPAPNPFVNTANPYSNVVNMDFGAANADEDVDDDDDIDDDFEADERTAAASSSLHDPFQERAPSSSDAWMAFDSDEERQDGQMNAFESAYSLMSGTRSQAGVSDGGDRSPRRVHSSSTIGTVQSGAPSTPARSTGTASAGATATTTTGASQVPEQYHISFGALAGTAPQKCGEGAYGTVYRCELGAEVVAVKQIRNMTMASPKVHEFIDEALIMARLTPHRNVVRFIGICLEPLCIVTEFLVHGSLTHVMGSADFSMTPALRDSIIADVAAGMRHLQRERLVHKDLAARNVLVGDEYVCKVSDFGMSRILDAEEQQHYSAREVGPLKWMAPESLQHKTYSTKTDVWAWAVTVVEVLTGKEPYPHLDLVQFATKFFPENLTLMDSLPDDTPTYLRDLLADCFDFDADKRPDFEQICERLNVQN